jgi:hypothetical protein
MFLLTIDKQIVLWNLQAFLDRANKWYDILLFCYHKKSCLKILAHISQSHKNKIMKPADTVKVIAQEHRIVYMKAVFFIYG